MGTQFIENNSFDLVCPKMFLINVFKRFDFLKDNVEVGSTNLIISIIIFISSWYIFKTKLFLILSISNKPLLNLVFITGTFTHIYKNMIFLKTYIMCLSDFI